MTQSTGSEAPAEAATDAPTGSPAQPRPTLPDGFGDLDRRAILRRTPDGHVPGPKAPAAVRAAGPR